LDDSGALDGSDALEALSGGRGDGFALCKELAFSIESFDVCACR